MIIANGNIEIKVKAVVGIAPNTGYPTAPAEVEWLSPIPCQYVVNNSTFQAKTNGEHYTAAHYTVYLEEQPLPDFEQLRLTAEDGRELGEFSLISQPEFLTAVGEIRLII